MGAILKGRVAVIAGAGHGFGRAHALNMAGQGDRVVVNDLGTSFSGKGKSQQPVDRVVGINPGKVKTMRSSVQGG